MRKIVWAALTACLLFCLLMPAQAVAPGPGEKKPSVIEIAVVNGKIDMGEKYAYAVPPGSTIRWTCDFAFEIQFDQNAPFETKSISVKTVEKKIKSEAKLLQIFKYTITVIKNKEVLTLDPVIIVRPPEP